jgi:L-ascorbate metabolism protein UlaG (beta-lactamase superfamily)
MRCLLTALFAVVVAACSGVPANIPAEDSHSDVTLTWLSVTNWLLEAGDTRILLDGYVSRIDRRIVQDNGTSTASASLDEAFVRKVHDVILPAGDLDWILVGHAHWDHAFDTPAWARITSARIGGARTVCHLLTAFGVARDRCMPLEGGEEFEAGPGVKVRVVRWHHSGDSTTASGRRLRAPLELRAPPPIDPKTGGLRPGFLEDYPNGGGARAYLITIATADGPVTLLWSNTGNAQAWDAPLPADSVFMRQQGVDLANLEWATSDSPTREHLATALREEGLTAVDLWVGMGVEEHVQQVVSLLHPRTFVPHHWDDFWTPISEGVNRGFASTRIAQALSSAGIQLLAPASFFDRVVLTPSAAILEEGPTARRALGVRD